MQECTVTEHSGMRADVGMHLSVQSRGWGEDSCKQDRELLSKGFLDSHKHEVLGSSGARSGAEQAVGLHGTVSCGRVLALLPE